MVQVPSVQTTSTDSVAKTVSFFFKSQEISIRSPFYLRLRLQIIGSTKTPSSIECAIQNIYLMDDQQH